MPKKSATEPWVADFREYLRDSYGYTEGWYVFNSRGKVRLQLLEEGKKPQSRILPFEWNKSAVSKALPYIQQVFKRYQEAKGKITLANACEVTGASDSNQKFSWNELLDEYRKFVPNASDTTWKKSYIPVLTKAGLAMGSKKKPINGEGLMIKSLTQWEQGTRSRQIARRSLKGFLDWAVMRGKLPAAYAPPAHIPEIRNPKRIGFALSDSQIIRLVDEIQDERWKFAVQLCAVYGLRPEELRHLRIKDGVNGKELWTIYQKSKGGKSGAKTEPRRIHPLLIEDGGEPIDWKLQSRIEIGEKLPPLGKEGNGGEALGTFLKRRPVWKSLQEEAKNIGEVLVPYTFRHRYAKQSHSAGFPVSNIAAAMGHTIEVHLESYSRFIPDGTADLYENRNKAFITD